MSARHDGARERNALIGRAVRRTVAAMLDGEVGTLAPDAALGEHLVRQLEDERLAVVSADVAADLAGDLYVPEPRVTRAPIAPAFWERLDRHRAQLLRAVDACIVRLRELDAVGQANEPAAQLWAVLDATDEALRRCVP